MNRLPLSILAATTLSLTVGCSKHSDSGASNAAQADATPSPSPDGSATLTSGATVNVTLAAAGSIALSGTKLNLTAPSNSYGETGSADLTSLKYFLTSVAICQNVTLNGTGFSNPTNCITLYTSAKNNQDLYNKMDQTEAAKAEYDDDFKDLMQGIKLTSTITSANIGTYKYALVNWMKPIKVTAKVKLDDIAGTMLYTHPGTYSNVTDQNNYVRYETLVPDFTTAPASETIAMLGNGGSIFSFGQPFTITADDVTNKTAFSMDLAFNPEGIVKGSDMETGLASVFGVDANGTHTGQSIVVPYISLIPLVHKAADAVVKETYLIHFTSGVTGVADTAGATPVASTDPFDVRLELYYLKDGSTITAGQPIASDLSEGIYGAHAELLFLNTASAKSMNPPNGFPNIFSFALDPASKEFAFYTWKGPTGVAPISKVKRLAAVGDSGTARLSCSNPGDGGFSINDVGCYDATSNTYFGMHFDVSYELVSRDTLADLTKASAAAIGDANPEPASLATATATATTP